MSSIFYSTEWKDDYRVIEGFFLFFVFYSRAMRDSVVLSARCPFEAQFLFIPKHPYSSSNTFPLLHAPPHIFMVGGMGGGVDELLSLGSCPAFVLLMSIIWIM